MYCEAILLLGLHIQVQSIVYGLDALMVEIINFFPPLALLAVLAIGECAGVGFWPTAMAPACYLSALIMEVTWRKAKVTLPIYELKARVLCTSW